MNHFLSRLKRHPFPVDAHFDFTLAMTFALPSGTLAPLVSPGLELDTLGEWGFLTMAMVQTRGLRPSFAPRSIGQDFFLAGYRIFTRFRSSSAGTVRGLQILRSDTDRRRMALAGNLFTGYNYHLAQVAMTPEDASGSVDIRVQSPGAAADVALSVCLHAEADSLPSGSPFAAISEARRYAGPMPYTFGYEEATNSMVLIRGVRRDWKPHLVNVTLQEATYFQQASFDGVAPVLAASFCVLDVPYHWDRGFIERLDRTKP